MKDLKTLKQLVCGEIDRHRDELIEFGTDIWKHPEPGYREFRTARAAAEKLEQLGLTVSRGLAYTGFRADLETGRPGPVVALIGEMDALLLPSHPEVYWGLPFRAPPSAKVVAAIERGESVDYADITSFADFVFIQLAWCNGGFAFGESRRLALARGEVRIRREYLKTLVVGEEAVIDRCCDIAETALREGGRHGA